LHLSAVDERPPTTSLLSSFFYYLHFNQIGCQPKRRKARRLVGGDGLEPPTSCV
jgi:hypothetical protein